MREDKLCNEALMASHTSPLSKSRRILIFFTITTIIALFSLLFFFQTHSANELPLHTDHRRYLNHYTVDNKSLRYGKYYVEFKLDVDADPDFGSDVICPSETNKEIKTLRVIITTETDHRLHLKITEDNIKRWEVPLDYREQPKDDQDFLLTFQRYNINDTGLKFTEEKFGLTLRDRDSVKDMIFSTEETYFRYMEQYLVIEFSIPSERIFGLGERLSNMNLREGNYTLFNRDQGAPIETGTNPGHNLYGSHPFVLYQLSTTKFAGIFFKTSNALQVGIKRGGLGTLLRFSTIGGIMDFHIFYKGDVEFIVEQYQALVGRPALPPLWALGYHYGREKVKSLSELKDLVNGFINKNIPVDSIWLGTEILKSGTNFVLDDKFKGLKEYVLEMKNKHNIHFVAVLEPGIKKDSQYFSVMNLVKDKTGATFIGKTHVGEVGFPNFWKEETKQAWKSAVKTFVTETGIDGFWLNRNEFSHLCDGECNSHISKSYPFVPGDTNLEKNTLPMDAIYETDDKRLSQFLTEFNVHSLNSLLMANATLSAFGDTPNRTFLATRSSYPGIQQFAPIHWFGETPPYWEQLKRSIPSVMNFAAYGMPVVGASIGGFNGPGDNELCDRWTQLGLLYPLSLNYKTEPDQPLSIRSEALTKNAIRSKYSILRYIYTVVFEQSKYGGLATRPTFFEFPGDGMAFRTMDRTFMYGKYLLVTSPLEGYQKSYSVYLPNANWYRFPSGIPVAKYSNRNNEGTMVQANVENEGSNLFIRGGGIVPYQDAIRMAAKNVEDIKDIPTTLIIALDENNEASGTIVIDDGNSKNGKYRHYSFTFRKRTLKIMLLEGHDYNTEYAGVYQSEIFTEIKILGASSLKAYKSSSVLTSELIARGAAFHYDDNTEVITLRPTQNRRIPWNQIETIALLTGEDYNFCVGGLMVKNIKVTDELRRLTAGMMSLNDGSEKNYTLTATLLNDYILNLHIKPQDYIAWEVPGIVDEKVRNTTKGTKSFGEYYFGVSSDPNKTLDFIISKPSDPEDVILNTLNANTAFDDQYIHLRSLLTANAIYGLGERVTTDFNLSHGVYTMFTRDEVSPIEDGKTPGKNMYGDHPFFMFRMFDGSFGGIFMLNSNPMDVIINAFDEKNYQVDHVAAGGIIDMFIIQSGTPKLIIEQYHILIGRPHLLPYWAFGNHQARYGYNTQKKLEEVVSKYEEAKIPLDALWIDIDYMDSLIPFTIDKTRYPSMQQFVNNLHKKNIKFIPLLEAAIPVNHSNEAYKKGLEMEVFLESGEQSKYKHVLGMAWAGYSTFVDFLHPKANSYWSTMLSYMHRELFPYDGIWLDMNEVTNFCDGECNLDGPNRKPLEAIIKNDYIMPYVPGHRYLQRKSLPFNAKHYSTELGNFTEYNMHSLYGHYQIKATNQYFAEKKQRPFIISRSTFAGSGRFGSHWLGDNKSRWPFLSYSIIGIYNFQMFGIPFTGADVCGFAESTTIELCQRWYQLAAFYPFCRNHNDLNTTSQEPYIDKELKDTAISALSLRYSLIRYFYTLHLDVAINGGVYFMPLFFEFVDDPETYQRTQHSFMVGSALKVTPILDKGVTKVNSYFPNSNWYSLDSGLKVTEYKSNAKSGKNLSLPADFNKINVHIQGGHIIPIQNANGVMTTSGLKNRHTDFVIAPNHLGRAEGFVLFDDEVSLNIVANDMYARIHLNYTNGNCTFERIKGSYKLNQGTKEESLGELRVFNAKAFSNTKTAIALLKDQKKIEMIAKYDKVNEVLSLNSQEDISLNDLMKIEWGR